MENHSCFLAKAVRFLVLLFRTIKMMVREYGKRAYSLRVIPKSLPGRGPYGIQARRGKIPHLGRVDYGSLSIICGQDERS